MEYSVYDLETCIQQGEILEKQLLENEFLEEEIHKSLARQGFGKQVWKYDVWKHGADADVIVVFSQNKEWLEKVSFVTYNEGYDKDKAYDVDGKILESPSDAYFMDWNPKMGELKIVPKVF